MALDALGPDRLLEAMSPALRRQLETRFAGQIDRRIAQAAVSNPRLRAMDLPPFKAAVDAETEWPAAGTSPLFPTKH